MPVAVVTQDEMSHPEESEDRRGLGYYLKLPFQIALIFLAAIIIPINLIFRKFVPNQRKNIEGEIVLITGAGNGVGRELTYNLAKRVPGIKLVLWDWDHVGNKATAENARSLGATVHCYKVDVSDYANVQKTAQQVIREVGEIGILINNAGISRPNIFLEQKPEDLESTIKINFLGNLWTLKEFLPGMVLKNKGHVVTICSGSAFAGMRYDGAYAASKFALRGFLCSLRSELRHHSTPTDNVKFTTVYPYFINTDMTKNLLLRPRFEQHSSKLDATECAHTIVDGMLRNEENIFLPASMELVAIVSILPSKLRNMLEDFTAYKTDFIRQN